MKKKYRTLVPVALILLMFVSIYSMITGAIAQQKEVNDLVDKAISCAEQGLYDKAASYYNEVIEKDNKIDYYLAVIDMYYDSGKYESSYKWCEKTLSTFPKDVRSYERMIRVCLEQKSYSDAYSTLSNFDGRKLDSETVEKYRSEMEYLYYVDTLSFDDVTPYSSNYVGFNNKGKWGLATVKGSSKVKAQYKQIGYFANDLVAVLDVSNIWYFMNADGEYVYNISDSVGGTITDVGLFNNDIFPVCIDGEYYYFDLDFTKKFGDYNFAGSFSGGVAAVNKDDSWQLINTNGENITGMEYDDIILDSRGVCCQNDRIFVKISDEYILINSSGERIGTETFEKAKLFSNGEYAAIMRGGLWGFVDLNGVTYMEPQFEDASSFSMGLAAVSDNDLWGYIDVEGTVIVELQYQECRNFASTGTAYVKRDADWAIIKLYKYNY